MATPLPKIERWQWQGGHRLEIRKLTRAVGVQIERLLFTRMPNFDSELRRVLRTGRFYYALHSTPNAPPRGRGGRVYEDPFFNQFMLGRCIILPRQKGPPGARWWLGVHAAEPAPGMCYITPPVGLIETLRPPSFSIRWAKRVASFDDPAAIAWAKRSDP